MALSHRAARDNTAGDGSKFQRWDGCSPWLGVARPGRTWTKECREEGVRPLWFGKRSSGLVRLNQWRPGNHTPSGHKTEPT